MRSAEDVIRRAQLETHPEYEDVSPMIDCAGFYTFRRYPPRSTLAKIVTNDGRPAVRCYLGFIVNPPAESGHIAPVHIVVWCAPRWRHELVFSTKKDAYAPRPGEPDAPSPQSATMFARARKPLPLNSSSDEGFIYDSREDIFIDRNGRVVAPVEMLDQMYAQHCRTLRLAFRVRWNIGSGLRWAVQRAVWRGQDVAMWALLHFYDMKLVFEDKKASEQSRPVPFHKYFPFHKYKPSDFQRITEMPAERSHFFGFQSSRKSFFTNLVVVATAVPFLYWSVPHRGLPQAIYKNTALTTAALIFAFLLADTLGPLLLIWIICALSRLRDAVLFVVRKVQV